MITNTNNEILKMGLTGLYNKAQITSAMLTELNAYVDANTEQNFMEVGYSSWNQALSTGLTFTSATRKATSAAGAVLITNKLTGFANMTLEGFKMKMSLLTAVVYQYSYNGTDWFTVPENDVCEVLTGDIYIKMSWNAIMDVTGLYILYK